jgi:protein O-GlcNAc transferase
MVIISSRGLTSVAGGGGINLPDHWLLDRSMEMKYKRAIELHRAGDPQQASVLYAEILESEPDHPDALHLLGVTKTQLGQAESGLGWIARSLAVNPHQPVAVANQGNALLALNRAAEALSSYEKALDLMPDYLLAVLGRGNALAALGRPQEALRSFDQALSLAPDFLPALGGRANVLQTLERYADALTAYERAIELMPALAPAHWGRGLSLRGLGEHSQALLSIDRALQMNPGYAEAFLARGSVLSEMGELPGAIDAYDRALERNPALAAAWFSRGVVLSLQARHGEAAESLRHALNIDPGYPYAQGAWLRAKLEVADWSAYVESTRTIIERIGRDERADLPFSLLAICDSPPLQLRCARRFAPPQANPIPRHAAERDPSKRIRVAYISADFLEHPTSYLMAGVFERHDRERFEIIGVSLRNDERSPTARRVRAAFEHWIDAGPRPDAQLATLIGDLQVDIAVDLMGYTGEHRAGLFARRPAPIQVSYLGFPASTGTPCMDYLIADDFLIPPDRQRDYSERIAYLPECFQANDDRKTAADEIPTREQAHLPANGFVWCSFHSTYKLNPPVFDAWARLLRAVPESVLWLLGGSPDIERNLRREASARGVDPRRLVFAPPEPYHRHLARLRLADACLDTYPFNGGATTSDALWAGVPVVTCAGASYAARMSGSLLTALGLPWLVGHSLEEYERLALQLARDERLLERTRSALAPSRRSNTPFDTDRFRRHLEQAYLAMVERQRRGLPPQTFRILPFHDQRGSSSS